MKVALYARVSTSDQDPEPQLSELRSFCDRQGWEVAATYTDVISGTKAKRPQLDRLMSAARQKKIDTVCVWKLDRFGRSQFDCLHKIEELDRWGVRFLATTQPIDTDQHNPASRLLLHVLGAAAEFERSLILERTQAGQARYRDAYEKGQVGKTVHSRSGKDLPPHRPRRIFDRDRVIELRRQGLSLRQIAAEMGPEPRHGHTDAPGVFQKSLAAPSSFRCYMSAGPGGTGPLIK